MIAERARMSGDSALASYVENAYKVRREPRWRHLQNDILESFGDVHRKSFIANVSVHAKDAYDSLIDNRNDSAHGRPINATLDDVAMWHGYAKQVLEAFEDALIRPRGGAADLVSG